MDRKSLRPEGLAVNMGSVWPEGGCAALQDCCDHTNRKIFKEEYASSVSGSMPLLEALAGCWDSISTAFRLGLADLLNAHSIVIVILLLR